MNRYAHGPTGGEKYLKHLYAGHAELTILASQVLEEKNDGI